MVEVHVVDAGCVEGGLIVLVSSHVVEIDLPLADEPGSARTGRGTTKADDVPVLALEAILLLYQLASAPDVPVNDVEPTGKPDVGLPCLKLTTAKRNCR